MENYKVFFTIYAFFFLVGIDRAQAYEPKTGNITATLGPIASQLNMNRKPKGTNNPIMGGFGIVANGDLSHSNSLETAIFYSPRLYYRTHDDFEVIEKVKRVHITLGHRWYLNRYLSTSAGFFSSYAIGDSQPYFTNKPQDPNNIIDTSADDLTEYGVDLAVQSDIWFDKKIAVVAEARYSVGLTPKSNESTDHYALMLGIRYLVQQGSK